jgi:hypothetical protein
MAMAMMHVRHVWMRVLHRTVLVEMGMRLAGWIEGAVHVTMMLVVHVRVRVGYGFVDVLVLVMLGQVQPYAQADEGGRNCELHGERLSERDDRSGAADERCSGEVGACPRGAEVAKGNDEERQARAVTEETDEASSDDLRNAWKRRDRQAESQIERTGL